MKINEILNLIEENSYNYKGGYKCPSAVFKILSKYINKDLVVAYYKNVLGGLFIIRTDKKCMAFLYIEKDIYDLRNCVSFHIERITLKKALSNFNKIQDYKVIDEEEFNKIRKKVILEGLE